MLFAAIKKEFKLVYRDLHSMLVLFAMPAVFIVIMSLALQGQFPDNEQVTMTLLYSVAEDDEYSEKLVESLSQQSNFKLKNLPGNSAGFDAGQVQKILADEEQYFLQLPANMLSKLQSDHDEVEPIKLWFAPNVDPGTRALVEVVVKGARAKADLYFMLKEQHGETEQQDLASDESIEVHFAQGAKSSTKTPTSVQQNVPAWLIFSMFFVVIPVSATLIAERQQGTLSRLKTMDISMSIFLLVKALPYLVINQLQLILMLLLGVFLVPKLGGDALVVGHHFGALALMSLAVGIAALGYALLVAVLAKTTEQAVSMGGVGNILLGAIGGIMVPKFLMPEYLQNFALISPMSWGLDGFLEIFLYDHGIQSILQSVAVLLAFGVALFSLALFIFYRQEQ